MKIAAILVVWFGLGSNQVLSTQKFDSLAECDSARSAIIAEFSKRYSSKYSGGDDVYCVSYVKE